MANFVKKSEDWVEAKIQLMQKKNELWTQKHERALQDRDNAIAKGQSVDLKSQVASIRLPEKENSSYIEGHEKIAIFLQDNYYQCDKSGGENQAVSCNANIGLYQHKISPHFYLNNHNQKPKLSRKSDQEKENIESCSHQKEILSNSTPVIVQETERYFSEMKLCRPIMSRGRGKRVTRDSTFLSAPEVSTSCDSTIGSQSTAKTDASLGFSHSFPIPLSDSNNSTFREENKYTMKIYGRGRGRKPSTYVKPGVASTNLPEGRQVIKNTTSPSASTQISFHGQFSPLSQSNSNFFMNDKLYTKKFGKGKGQKKSTEIEQGVASNSQLIFKQGNSSDVLKKTIKPLMEDLNIVAAPKQVKQLMDKTFFQNYNNTVNYRSKSAKSNVKSNFIVSDKNENQAKYANADETLFLDAKHCCLTPLSQSCDDDYSSTSELQNSDQHRSRSRKSNIANLHMQQPLVKHTNYKSNLKKKLKPTATRNSHHILPSDNLTDYQSASRHITAATTNYHSARQHSASTKKKKVPTATLR